MLLLEHFLISHKSSNSFVDYIPTYKEYSNLILSRCLIFCPYFITQFKQSVLPLWYLCLLSNCVKYQNKYFVLLLLVEFCYCGILKRFTSRIIVTEPLIVTW